MSLIAPQDIESFETSPPVMTQSVKKSWGVRRESLTQNTVERTVNPTEVALGQLLLRIVY